MAEWIKRYRKFIVAGVAAGAVALQAALTDSVVTNAEWVTIGLAVAAALGVVVVPNAPKPPAS